MTKGLRIKHHAFKGEASITQTGLDPHIKLKGTIDGGVANGTLRMTGQISTDDSNDTTCDTGTVHWTADKNPPPN